jgi:hypothetical protein
MPGSELVVYQAEPGSESERRLRGLVVDVSDAADAQPEELSA